MERYDTRHEISSIEKVDAIVTEISGEEVCVRLTPPL